MRRRRERKASSRLNERRVRRTRRIMTLLLAWTARATVKYERSKWQGLRWPQVLSVAPESRDPRYPPRAPVPSGLPGGTRRVTVGFGRGNRDAQYRAEVPSELLVVLAGRVLDSVEMVEATCAG